jgi:phosphohistidine swiveling domain-containing protein
MTEAMQEMAPFVVATPTVLGMLTSSLAKGIPEEAGKSRPETEVSGILARVLTAWYDPDPVGDMRNGCRIALEVLNKEDASELFRTTSPSIALSRVKEEFPDLHQMIGDHVDEYGWLRTQGYRYGPMSPEALVYRIQLALIRWPVEAIREAAHSEPVPVTEQVLGFPPSESLAGQIAALQAMLTQRALRVDVHLQAECMARPLLARIADALGCTETQILFSSVEEVVAALSHQRELPTAEIDSRAGNGFTVQRDDDAVVIHSEGAGSTGGGGLRDGAGALTGMTACRGTAVGRVKIVLDQEELFRLEIGDVLVTAASTIDPTDVTGETTVFPTRNGGPHAQALERAAAVVADEGGLLSHAAIVCRERGLPSVLGTEIATTSLVDGQVVEVDATKPVGVVIPLGPSW